MHKNKRRTRFLFYYGEETQCQQNGGGVLTQGVAWGKVVSEGTKWGTCAGVAIPSGNSLTNFVEITEHFTSSFWRTHGQEHAVECSK